MPPAASTASQTAPKSSAFDGASVPDTRCGVLAVRASYCLGAETSVRPHALESQLRLPQPQLVSKNRSSCSKHSHELFPSGAHQRLRAPRVSFDPKDVYLQAKVAVDGLSFAHSRRASRWLTSGFSVTRSAQRSGPARSFPRRSSGPGLECVESQRPFSGNSCVRELFDDVPRTDLTRLGIP